jgi:16S rRNA (uracil1498-N3)-methyltransferase
MHVFYEPRIRETLALSDEESKHAVNVLRMTNGQVLYVNDGGGNMFKARIAEAHPKKVTVEIVERVQTKNMPRHIHIAVGITRQTDRLEWFVEKATEVGVREITLLVTQNTARHKVNVDRLNKIAVAAIKQSGNVFLPSISEPTPFKLFVGRPNDALKLICTAAQDRDVKSIVNQHENVIALVGPEGDFTEEELTLAHQNGFQPVSLGPYRLRTETAALSVACALALL